MLFNPIILFCLKSIVAIYFIVSTLFVCWALTLSFRKAETPVLQWCAIYVVGLWLSSVGFHILISLNQFNLAAAFVSVTIALIICRFYFAKFSAFISSLKSDLSSLAAFFSEKAGWTSSFVFSVGAVLLLTRTLILPPLAWDTLTYHAVKAAMWVQNGHIWLMEAPGGWNQYRSYPGGGEIFQAWAILPFKSDLLLGSVDWVHWIFLILALYAFGKIIGLEGRIAFTGAVYSAFVPSVLVTVGSGYVDLPLGLLLVLTAVFIARFFQDPKPAYLILGFMALGVAGGIKFFAGPHILALSFIVLVYITSKKLWPRTIKPLCLSFLAVAAPALPWLFYNYLETGFPLFPLEIKIAGLQLGVTTPELVWYKQLLQLEPYKLGLELKKFLLLFAFPLIRTYPADFAIWNILILAFLPAALFRLYKKSFWMALVPVSIIGAAFIAYFLPDFSVVRILWATSNARFLYPAFFLMTMVCFVLVQDMKLDKYLVVFNIISLISLTLIIYFNWAEYELFYIIPLSVFLVSIILAPYFLGGKLQAVTLIVLQLALLIGFLNLMQVTKDHLRSRAARESYFFHSFPRYWVPAAEAVDDPNFSRNIAVTSGLWQPADNWPMFPFLGRRLQNKLYYVPVSENGSLTSFTPWTIRSVQVSYDNWLQRLREKGITEVISFEPRSLEMEWMEAHPDVFPKIVGTKNFGLFRVLKPQ